MGIFTPGINKMAYGTPLFCPHPHPKDHNRKCNSQRWKEDKQRSNPFRIRYICKDCGKGVIYEISQYNPKLTKAFK
jgi:hypothetical protein